MKTCQSSQPRKAIKKSKPHNREPHHFFPNLYLFPKELQRFLRRLFKKSTFASKKAIVSYFSSADSMNFKLKSPIDYRRNLQKIHLLSSLQQKQVQEVLEPQINEGNFFEKSQNAETFNGKSKFFQEENWKNQRNSFSLNTNLNESSDNETLIKSSQKLETSLEESGPNTSFSSMQLMKKLNENCERTFNVIANKNESFSEITLKKHEFSSYEFLETSTKDENGVFELENLDFSAYNPSFYQYNGYRNTRNANYFEENNKEIRDLMDLTYEQVGRESLMEHLLLQENNHENGFYFFAGDNDYL